jgi:glycosyltransferase involved in cell wall biosynthesis
MLAQANVPCSLEIYGMIEDEQYWRECQALIKRLPSHITVTHHGGVHPEHVQSAFASFHFFLFPTRGENFGHVIVESLLAGTPVLISDRTPWGALELASAGWCTPLSDVKRWVELLRACALMDDVKFQQHSRAASTFSGRWLAESGTDKQTEEMLRFLVR